MYDRDDFVDEGARERGNAHNAQIDDDGFSKRKAKYARRLAEIQERALAAPDDATAIELVADAIYADPMALGFAMDAEADDPEDPDLAAPSVTLSDAALAGERRAA
jgi:hypothetical protein